MKKIGIFFGSDTGNTEKVAKLIHQCIGEDVCVLYDISNTNRKDIEKFHCLIFGVPTWYYGEIQCDWDDFLPILKKIDLSNKCVALFGCGDQEDYSEYFCDAVGIIYKILKNNNVHIVGKWSTKDYYFEQSKALLNKDYFAGLILDEDRQAEKTKERVTIWVKKIMPHFQKKITHIK